MSSREPREEPEGRPEGPGIGKIARDLFSGPLVILAFIIALSLGSLDLPSATSR